MSKVQLGLRHSIANPPKYRNPSLARRPKIECQKFRKLLDTKRACSDCETLKQATRVFLLSLIDPPQNPLVRFIQAVRQFVEKLAEVRGEAAS
jgi:hypothetical protein